jgi:MFS transporter, DHA2 family, methylenomycin A resistance protein
VRSSLVQLPPAQATFRMPVESRAGVSRSPRSAVEGASLGFGKDVRLTLLHDLPLVDHYFHPSGRHGSTELALDAGRATEGDAGLRARLRVLAAVTTVTGLIGLDATVVSVALPAIRDDLGGGSATIEWVASVYVLTFAVTLLPAGRLVDRAGAGRSFLVGSAVYVGAALLGAAAVAPWMLILGRGLQGIGAGIVSPAGLVLLTRAYGAERRGYAIGLMGMILGVFAAVGPLVGGAFTDTIGWRAIFVVHAILALAALLLVRDTVRPRPRSHHVELQLRAVLLLAGVVLGIQICIIEGHRIGWPVVAAFGTLALVCALALRRVERRSSDRVVDFSLLRLPPVAASAISRSVVSFAFYGNLFYLTLFLQASAGYSAFQTGLILLPSSVGGVLASPFVGRVVDRTGPVSVMTAGVTFCSAGLFALVLIDANSSVALHLVPALLLNGLGYAMVSVSAKTAPLAAVSDDLQGRVSSLVSFVSRIAAGFGVTFATGVFHVLSDRGIKRALDDQRLPARADTVGFVDKYLGVDDLVSHLDRDDVRAAGFSTVSQAATTVDHAFAWIFAATMVVLGSIVAAGGVAIVILVRRGAPAAGS